MSLIALAACGFPRPADVAECQTASDCKSPDAPLCIAGSCVAACQANEDCAGLAATPFCRVSSGTCVGCLDASVCTAARPVCDATDGSCRACSRDDECSGGVCIEADGTCVADRDFVFVDGRGGIDSGTCTRSAPCKTLAFAMSAASAALGRIQVKVVSPELVLPSTVNLVRDLYLEGSDTTISGSGATGMFKLQGVNTTLSHVSLLPPSGQPVTVVDGTRVLHLFDVQTAGAINVDPGGDLEADQTTFTNGGGVACTGGTITVRRSTFAQSPLQSMTCTVVVRRTRFNLQGDGNIFFGGGSLTFENNLIAQSVGIGDAMTVSGQAPPGRTVRFNTFVSSDAPSDGNALGCTPPVDVTSNIFAYNSMHPNSLDCGVRYSLYDSVALPQFAIGVGVVQGDRSAFFVDLPGKDFHLSGTSRARGASEPGLGVSDDFDGNPRPAPVGSVPDMGAFEAR